MTPLKSCAFVRRKGSDMDYKYHETEICHNGRLGCWVEPESGKDRAVRWVLCALELMALGLVVVGFCAFCAVC